MTALVRYIFIALTAIMHSCFHLRKPHVVAALHFSVLPACMVSAEGSLQLSSFISPGTDTSCLRTGSTARLKSSRVVAPHSGDACSSTKTTRTILSLPSNLIRTWPTSYSTVRWSASWNGIRLMGSVPSSARIDRGTSVWVAPVSTRASALSVLADVRLAISIVTLNVPICCSPKEIYPLALQKAKTSRRTNPPSSPFEKGG